jgi:hypothetical protein
VRLFRNPGFVAAVAMCAILLLYFGLIADRAAALFRSEGALAHGFGVALLVFPLIGVWWMLSEWRLGMTVQRMADDLDREGRLPVHDGETLPSGRLTADAAEAVFEKASRAVEAAPDDWRSWFHVAYAYDAVRDRSEARRALRQAADLYRSERRRS